MTNPEVGLAMDELENGVTGQSAAESLLAGEEPAWDVARNYLGDDQLAQLLQIPQSSVQHYALSERHPPEVRASKLRWLALVISYLSGTYNEFSVYRWFERPRTALEGRSPLQTLLAEGSWVP